MRQHHAGVIGPRPRHQTVGTADPEAGHLGERTRRLELDGGAKGIADGKTEERTA